MRPPIQGLLVHDHTMARLPYDRPRAEVIYLKTEDQSLLVSFSVEGEFEDFEDEGEL